MTIGNDNIQTSDSIHFGDYIPKRTQLEFLKGFINDNNLVLDIDNDKAYLELQDEGIEPVGTSPATLPSISIDAYDLTNIVSHVKTVDIEYLQGSLVYLKQKIITTDYVDTLAFFPYQELGSYLYDLNTFANNTVSEYESFFNGMLDGESYYLRGSVVAGDYPTTWDNYISSRFGYVAEAYDEQTTLDFVNADASTTSVNSLINNSYPVMFSGKWNKTFLNTLNQKKNNKIIEVTFPDELGTIINNRREYILDNQVYKIITWDYDLQTKLVKANLIMK